MASSTLAWARWQVVGVGGFGVEAAAVGDEAVVAPVRPQGRLWAFEAGAAHHEAQSGEPLGSRRPVVTVVSATCAVPS